MKRRNPCFFRRLRTLSIAMGVYTPSAVFMGRGSRSSGGGAVLGIEVYDQAAASGDILGLPLGAGCAPDRICHDADVDGTCFDWLTGHVFP
jgi:hypothetical protein